MAMEIIEIPQEDLKAAASKIETMMVEVAQFEVKNEQTLTDAAERIKAVKDIQKYIEAEKAKYVDPAMAIIKNAKEKYDPYLAACKTAEKTLKDKAQVFMLAEAKKKEGATVKFVERVERGTMKPETAIRKIEEVGKVQTTVKTATGGGLSMRMIDEVVITDATKIPDEWYKPRELDMVRIKKAATAGVSIPGVEVKKVPSMASKSR